MSIEVNASNYDIESTAFTNRFEDQEDKLTAVSLDELNSNISKERSNLLVNNFDHSIDYCSLIKPKEYCINFKQETANNSADPETCPEWAVHDIEQTANIVPLFYKVPKPSQRRKQCISSYRHIHALANDRKYHFHKRPGVHKYLSETDVNNSELFDTNYGQPTRTKLLQAHKNCHRELVNAYDLYREKLAKLIKLYSKRIVMLNFNEFLEVLTKQPKHTFLSGSRYNWNNYVDSECIKTWGIYMLRNDPLKIYESFPQLLNRWTTELSKTKKLLSASEDDLRSQSAPSLLQREDDLQSKDKEAYNTNENSSAILKSSATFRCKSDTLKMVLPTVNGISFNKLLREHEHENTTANSSAQSRNIKRQSSANSFTSKATDASTSLQEVRLAMQTKRDKRLRRKPPMVDQKMNFPPTASEFDANDAPLFQSLGTRPISRSTKHVSGRQPLSVEGYSCSGDSSSTMQTDMADRIFPVNK